MIPIKIVKDVNPASAPENSSNLNVNINYDILKSALVNEQGFDNLNIIGKKIIGNCILPDNSVCVFSIIDEVDSVSEIGIIKENEYIVICKDYEGVAELGFSTEHQIQAECKVNYNGDYIIYWVDGFNPDRWLNLNNPQIQLDSNKRIIDKAQLSLMLNFAPTKGEYLDNTSTVIVGGSLTAAVYYVIITYGDKFKNFTKTLYVSPPLPVVKSTNIFNTDYIGSEAGEATNKALQIFISSTKLNIEYEYLKVNVIKKENQILTGYEFGVFPFSNSNFSLIIDSLTNEVTVDSILINNADYISSLTVTQLDDVLYKAHLRSRNRFDFQPYVNNIKTNYIQKLIDLSSTSPGQNYRDPNLCFYSKGFMYDEVYALYASFIIEEEGYEYETDAYHIPGRKTGYIDLGGTFTVNEDLNLSTISAAPDPTQYVSGDYYSTGAVNKPINQILSVNNQAKIFHAINTADYNSGALLAPLTNMAYWENKDENYSTEDKWLVYDATGNQIDDFKGEKVRHHKFPEPTAIPKFGTIVSPSEKYIHPSLSNYNQVNILGIELSNIIIPVEYVYKVKKIKMYYAKRDYNNRTILGQSLVETLNGLHYPGNSDVEKNKIFNSVGNMLFGGMPSFGGGDPHKTGLYPLTYELNGAQGTALSPANPYTYDESFAGGPSDPYSGYMKMKPFDMMQQSLTPNTASYIKNLYRIQSGYDGQIFPDTDLSTSAKSIKIGFIFDPTGKHIPVNFTEPIYQGINKNIITGVSPYANMYRKIENIEYVDMNTPNQSVADQTSSPYNFTMFPFNYNGEKAIWVKTNTRLYQAYASTSSIESQIDGDIAAIGFNTNSIFNSYISGDGEFTEPSYCSPYISNICAFKLNIFESFDNQVLCDMGVADITSLDFKFYGGDTFTNVYSERETLDLSAYTPGGDNTNAFITGIHNYICQTTSNVNYRYKGDNNWETFYPVNTFVEMSNLPFINPEWYGYNVDYSSNNDLLQPIIASNYANQIQSYFPNRVIRSAKDNPETIEDNYLIYEAGSYVDIGKIKGVIENITNQNNKLIIKTKNALFYTLGREVINTENSESYVGSGDIFAVKPKETVSSQSYGGGSGRFSDIVNQYGYFYADSTNGIIYCSNGESINEISREGLEIFFRDELKFKLPNQLINKYLSILPAYSSSSAYLADWYVKHNGEIWKSNKAVLINEYPGTSEKWNKVNVYTLTDNVVDIQGIGIKCAFDYKYRRYIVYKKDYNFVEFETEWLSNIPTTASPSNYNKIVYYNGVLYKLTAIGGSSIALPRGHYGIKINFKEYFEDKYFTIAYYPEIKSWVSLYQYKPEFIFNSIDKVYSTKNNALYKHNSDEQNAYYYDNEEIISFVEPILNQPSGVKRYRSLAFWTDVFTKSKDGLILDYLSTFKSYFVRTTKQLSKNTLIKNGKTSRNSERYFLANDFRDLTKNSNVVLMSNDYITEPILDSLNLNKHFSLQQKFVDYYLIPRFIFDNKQETIIALLDLSINISNKEYFLESVNYTFNIGDIIEYTYSTFTTKIIITEVLEDNLYNFKYFSGDALSESTPQIVQFKVNKNQQIYIYDITNESNKNIR